MKTIVRAAFMVCLFLVGLSSTFRFDVVSNSSNHLSSGDEIFFEGHKAPSHPSTADVLITSGLDANDLSHSNLEDCSDEVVECSDALGHAHGSSCTCGADHVKRELTLTEKLERNWAYLKYKTQSTLRDMGVWEDDRTEEAAMMMASETLPAGTLIIPMDNTLQGNFNERAYGLAIYLLHADIPLKWIIDPTKNRNGADFSARARRRYPSTSSYANRQFRSGPVAITPGFEAAAQTVINSYNGLGTDVNVYELENATTVNVDADLVHKPYIAVLDDGGNEDIHEDVLTDIDLVSGTHYDIATADDLTASSCFTMASEPHSSFDDDTKVTNVANFVKAGGNFFAQCAAIRSYQENTVKLFPGSGYIDEMGFGDPFGYDNFFEPMAQFQGDLDEEGGSVEDFGFNTDPAGGTRIIYDLGDPDQYKAYVGRIPGFTASAGGYVHYLGGHKYDGSGIGQINGRRMLLNAALRSAERPPECGLTLACPDEPIVTLSSTSGSTCNTTPITVSGNTFSGSATQVTITENGAGSVTPGSTSSSPFSFTYTPAAGDVGNVVTITVITDNPLGGTCEPDTATYTLTVNALPNVTLTLGDDQTCVDETSVTLTGGSPAGGTYSGTAVSGGVFNPSAAGVGVFTITYTFTDANGCTNSATDDITVNALPASPSVTVVCNAGVGEVTVNSPTGPQFQYQLDAGPFQSSNVFSGVADGSHTVTVRNTSTGCQNTGAPFDVDCSCPDQPTLTLSSNSGSTCEDQPITVSGNTFGGSATSVTITENGAGSVTPTSTSSSPFSFTYTPTAADAGNVVTITVTTNNPLGAPCMAASETYTLTVNALPTVTFTLGDDETCVSETSVPLTGGSPAGGTYSGPGVTGSNFNPSSVGVGTYTITYTYTDANGCTDSATDDITVFDDPAEATYTIDCSGGPGNGVVTVTSPLGGQYEYQLDGGTPQASPEFTGVSQGSHTITVININTNCQTTGAPFDVDCACPDPPSITLSSSSGSTCEDQPITVSGNTFGGSATSVTITENGAGSVTPTSTSSSPFSFTYTPTAADAGNVVTITVTTNNPLGAPCVAASETYALTVNALPTVTFTLGDDETCVSETSVPLTGGSPAGGTYSGPGVTGSNFNPSSVGIGTYTITYTYTDANGCTDSATDDITVFDDPAEATYTIDCDGGPGNGVVTVTSPLGGQYEYQLDGGTPQASPEFTGVSQGSHTITVININTNCQTTGAPFDVDCACPDPPTVTLSSSEGETCEDTPITISGNTFGGNATQVDITHNGNGTVSPTSSTVSPFSFTYNPDPSDAGNIVTITVTTNNPYGPPCSQASATYALTVNSLPTVTLTLGDDAACVDETSVPLTGGSPSGGTYSGTAVSGGVFNPSSAGVGTFTITYTFTDANGCINSATDDITVNPLPTVTLTLGDEYCAYDPEVSLTGGSPSGGTYSGPGVSSNRFDPAAAGPGVHTITYTYSDANGCTDSATDIVTVYPKPIIGGVSTTDPTECGLCDGTITLTGVDPNSGPYLVTYTRDGIPQSASLTASGGTITLTGLCEGSYDDFVISQNGCISDPTTGPFILSDPPLPNGSIAGPATACLNESTGLYSVSGLGNCASCSYQWTSPGGLADNPTGSTTNFTFSSSGIQTIFVTLTNGVTNCANTLEYQVDVYGTPIVSGVSQGTCIGTTRNITVNASVSPPETLEYSLDGGPYQLSNMFNNVPEGLHSVMVRIVGTLCTSATPFTFDIDCTCPTPASAIIDGPTEVCSAETAVYTGSFVNTDNGTWSILSGGGSLSTSVCAINGCQTTYTPGAPGTVIIRLISDDPDGVGPCQPDTNDYSVLVKETPTISSSDLTNPSMCGSCDGSIRLLGVSPDGTYNVTYTKDGAIQSAVITSVAGVIEIAGLCEGSYADFVLRINGCESSPFAGPIVLSDPASPSGSITGPATACLNESTGLYEVTGLADCASCEFAWSSTGGLPDNPTGASTNFTFTSSGLQTVELRITSATTGCRTILNFDVDVYGVPQVNGVSQSDCISDAADVTVNASVTPPAALEYSLDGGPYQASNVFTAVPEGAHEVMVRIVGTTCTSTNPFTFEVNCDCLNQPSATITGPLTTCADVPVNLIGNLVNASSGTWAIESGSGSLNTTICSGSGCIVTYTPDAGIIADATVRISLTTEDPDGLGPCVPNTYVHEITVYAVPMIASLTKFDPTECEACNGSFTISGMVPGQLYQVSYNGPGGPQSGDLVANPNGQITIGGLCEGTYDNIIVGRNGCESAPGGPVTLVEPNDPPAPSVNNNGPLCTGDQLQLSAVGEPGATYFWTGPNGFSSNLQNPQINNIGLSNAGDYCAYQVVDNCPSPIACTTLEVNPTPEITNISSQGPSTCEGSDGSITLSGLEPSTTYLVEYVSSIDGNVSESLTSDGGGQLTIGGLAAGTYSMIRVTAQNCTSDAVGPVTLNDPNPPAAPGVSSNGPVCERETIELTATGEPGAIFNWTGPNGFTAMGASVSIPNATLSMSGLYSVTQTVDNCVSPPANINVVVYELPATGMTISSDRACVESWLTLNSEFDVNINNIFWYKEGQVAPIATGFGPIDVQVEWGVGYYHMLASSNEGCEDRDTVFVEPLICADPDINQTVVNTPVSGDVSTNDDYPVGSQFMVLDTDPNGSIVLNSDGSYDYTPNTNFVGTSFYTYKVCGPPGFSICDTTTLTIEVRPGETGPENTIIAQDDHNTTPLNTPVTSCILCNDSDPQGDNIGSPVQLPGGDIPAGSTVVFNPDGTVTYTPPTDFVGMVTIPYEICDDGYPVACDQANLYIDIVPQEIGDNQTYANDDAYVTNVDEPLTDNVSLNDNDPQGDNVVNTLVPGTEENGTVVLNPNGTFTFTPAPGYTGPASFVYSACDDGSPQACDTATAYITIHEPYIEADPDINQTLVNTPVSGDVSTNDEAPEGSTFMILDTDPNGTIVMNADGTYDYTPNTNFVGTSFYTYKVCSPSPSVVCDTTTLTIEVRPGETGPENTVIAQDDHNTTPLNTPVTSCILCNDSDPQGDNIGSPVQLPGGDIPAGSTVVFNPDGTVTYTPPTDFVGVVTIPYEICDDGVPQACDQANLIIDVVPLEVGYNTTYANDDAYVTNVDEPLMADVSLNDNDPQGDDVINTLVPGTEENGTVILNPDGTFTFTPDPGYTGPATFVYSACDDGVPQACDTATAYITIHAPYIEADPDINQTLVNTPVSGDVSTNDEAPEGSTFMVLDTDPNGSIVMNSDGTYDYTPNTDFVGTSFYTYKVCSPSPSVVCDTTTLTIEVRPEETGPENSVIAQDDHNTTPLNTPVTSCILCNDSDPQGDNLGAPVQLPGGDIPSGSTVVFNLDGTVTYTPPTDFVGVVTIPYEVCDDGTPVACDQANLIIDVVPVEVGFNTTYANDDAYVTNVDEPLTADVSLNDNDPQGDDVINTLVPGSEENGTVALNPDGTFTFTPDPGYTGPATFVYSACDDGVPQACDTATAYITIHEPYIEADPDINQTLVNTPVSGDVSTNDEAPEGSMFMIVETDPNGSIVMNPDGTYDYTPNTNFVGTSFYTYKVCAPTGFTVCDTTTLTIEVRPGETGPENTVIAQDDHNTTPLNTPVTSCILCNDSDPQGDNLGTPVQLGGGDIPAGSTVVFNPDGTVTFTPPLDFVGVVTIPYEVCDDGYPVACDQANLIIDVVPLEVGYNTTYANDDAYVTNVDEPLTSDVSLNDNDPQGDDVVNTLVPGSEENGTVALNPDGTFTFTPDPGYTGPATFVYSACDDGIPQACDTATAYITIHEPYIEADPDINQTLVNTPVSGDVSTNDEAPEGSMFMIVDSDPNGTITMNPDGTYDYTPNTNFVGTSFYTYKVCSPSPSVVCDTTTLTIEVRPGEIGPENTVIAQDDHNTTPLNTPVTSCILCNDSDPQGDNIGSPVQLPGGDIPAGSTVIFNPDGTVTFTPPTDFVGVATIPYEICDDGVPVACDQANLIIDVVPLEVNYNTTYANDDAYTTLVNEKLSGDVGLNDNDPQGDDVMFTLVPGTEENGTVMLDMDGTFMFTPDTDYTGPATFVYSVCDKGTPEACDTATAYITVHEPYVEADPDINQTLVNTPVSGDVSTNDEAPEGSMFMIVDSDPNGTITMNPDGTYDYTPNTNFVGTSFYTYKVCSPSPSVVCDTTTLTIEVRPGEIGPENTVIAQDDHNTTPLGTPVTSCILCNDSDPQGDNLGDPVQLPGGDIPAGSTVVFNPDGTVTYTPPADFVGVVTIPYEVCDDGYPVACDQANIIIDVVPLDVTYNTTYANDDAYITLVNEKLSGDVGLNDNDPQGDDVMFTLVPGTEENGTVMLDMDGSFMFTPDTDYTGPATFVYSVCDKGTPEACDTATAYITVHEPYVEADPDINQTLVNIPVTGDVSTNDEAPEGSMFMIVETDPNGTIVMNPDGTYEYTPNTDFEGTSSYTYKVCSPSPSVVCDTTTLTIEVRPEVTGPDNSIIAQDDHNTTPLGTPVTSCILCNDSDPQGDDLGTPVQLPGGNIPAGSTVVFNPDGTVTYTPPTDFVGVVVIPYEVCDEGRLPTACDQANIIIDVVPLDITYNTTYANDDAYITYRDEKLSEDVGLNDNDPQGDDVMFTLVPGTEENGTVMLDMNGSFMFTPDPGYTGPATFVYSVCDKGTPEACDTATAYITVHLNLGAISDFVWKDLNGNGIQDQGEPGVAEVIVNAYTCSGEYVKSDTTDSEGSYIIDELEPFDSYYLIFDLSLLNNPECVFTFANEGNDDSGDSDVNAAGVGPCVFIEAGEVDSTYDAGLVQLASIESFVWQDRNADGLQDGGDEGGIQDITAKLYDEDGILIAEETTNSDGIVFFDNLLPQSYYIEYEIDNDWSRSPSKIGSNDEIDSDVDDSNGPNTTRLIDLEPGENDLTWDLGLYKCIETGDFVWFDLNANGIQDAPENGINGVRVYVYDASGNLVDQAVTGPDPRSASADGYYKFCLDPGTYYIVFERPGHLAASMAFAGGDNEKDSDITNTVELYSTSFFSVRSGDMRCDIDGGFHSKATMGDRVWLDENGNGVQDGQEPRVANVVVSAYNTDGVMFWQDRSDNNGEFYMDGLSMGEYYLKFDPPAGYTFTLADQGGDDGRDSDVDGSNGPRTTALYRVNPGEHEPDVDGGLVQGFLPIELINFEAEYVGEKVEVTWTTAVEINNDYFEVERRHESEDAFRVISKVDAAGTVYTTQDYGIDDYDVSRTGVYFYRLRQVDNDGTDARSEVRTVEVRGAGNSVTLYPNPASNLVTVDIQMGLGVEEAVELQVIDPLGRMLSEFTKSRTLEDGRLVEELNIENLAPGMYTVQITMGSETKRLRFTKM